MKGMLAGKHPYVLYYLTAAMRPRMLMTVDGEGKLLPVPVRVGQAIDTVAQVCDFPGASAWYLLFHLGQALLYNMQTLENNLPLFLCPLTRPEALMHS